MMIGILLAALAKVRQALARRRPAVYVPTYAYRYRPGMEKADARYNPIPGPVARHREELVRRILRVSQGPVLVLPGESSVERRRREA